MDIVIVGHVDHGKSTLIGRLLADTNSLPEGKLEQVKLTCERNAKPFEYAFLLDALKDEQSQGITIDTARCFFKSDKRPYIIIDAPGHIEFLKNMITGASRAEAALLVIDAKEGIQENSRRHGYMLSLLGIKQIVVLVNKMDLVNYDQSIYDTVVRDFKAFLAEINVTPITFIPIAAREGDSLISTSPNMPWYTGKSVLDTMDELEETQENEDLPFRFPVQDIYKFTQDKDDRRIIAGTLQSGSIQVGESVTFWPSGKKSLIQSIEGFNIAPQTEIKAGEATGFTLSTQLYIKPGELMCKTKDPQPQVASTFKASLFWLGKTPMKTGKKYKIKLSSSRNTVYLKNIISVLNAAELTRTQKKEIERHEVAHCTLETLKPIAFDLASDLAPTGRFVIIDDYEIAGGGIITESITHESSLVDDYIYTRDQAWEKSQIPTTERAEKFNQTPQLILITGDSGSGKSALAKSLEIELFSLNKTVYYVGISNIINEIGITGLDRDEQLHKLGLTAHMFTDAGIIFITTLSNLDDTEARLLKTLTAPHETILISIGEPTLVSEKIDCHIATNATPEIALATLRSFLQSKGIIPDYFL